MFKPVRDSEGKVICRVDENGHVEIEKRIHGRKQICIVDPREAKVLSTTRGSPVDSPK